MASKKEKAKRVFKKRKAAKKAKPKKAKKAKKAKPKKAKKAKKPRRVKRVKRKRVLSDSQEAAKEKIGTRLDATATLTPRIRVWPYSDGTIDGEALFDVVRGQSAHDLLLDIESLFATDGVGRGYWISVGVRFTIKEDDEVYRRFKGYNDVNTHFQRAIRPHVGEVFLIAREQIVKGMEEKYGRKADSVYVRLHWNSEDAKPLGREPER